MRQIILIVGIKLCRQLWISMATSESVVLSELKDAAEQSRMGDSRLEYSLSSVESFKGGGLEIEAIRQPGEVNPAGVIDAHVDMKNNENFIYIFDPDACNDVLWYGYQYEVAVIPSWTEGTEPIDMSENCLTMGDRRTTHRFDFRAPEEEGIYTVNYVISLPGSGETAQFSREIVVDSGSGDRPGAPGEDGADTSLPVLLAGVAGGSALLVLVALIVLA